MLKIVAVLMLTWAFTILAAAQQAVTVFRGTPTIKVSEGGLERVAEPISPVQAPNLVTIISRIGNQFYWASRENKGLIRSESGAFITFTAEDGSGYVRIVNPELKAAAALLTPTEAKFSYVEHLLVASEA